MTRDSNPIDRAQSRRRRIVAILAIFLMSAQGGVLAATEQVTLHGGRLVDQFRVWSFVVLALAFLAFLVTGGRRAREIDDELVRANRASAIKHGYVALILVLVGVYVARLLVPFDVMTVVPVLIAFGIVVPALCFAVLERRGAE